MYNNLSEYYGANGGANTWNSATRQADAKRAGITGYEGTASQNTQLLKFLTSNSSATSPYQGPMINTQSGRSTYVANQTNIPPPTTNTSYQGPAINSNTGAYSPPLTPPQVAGSTPYNPQTAGASYIPPPTRDKYSTPTAVDGFGRTWDKTSTGSVLRSGQSPYQGPMIDVNSGKSTYVANKAGSRPGYTTTWDAMAASGKYGQSVGPTTPKDTFVGNTGGARDMSVFNPNGAPVVTMGVSGGSIQNFGGGGMVYGNPKDNPAFTGGAPAGGVPMGGADTTGATPYVSTADQAFKDYLDSLKETDEEKEAKKYLNQLVTDGKLANERALNSGETMGFAGGEAQRVGRNNDIRIAGAASNVDRLTGSRANMTAAQKARLDYVQAQERAQRDANPAFNLSAGQERWGVDPKTGVYGKIASAPKDPLDTAYRQAQIDNLYADNARQAAGSKMTVQESRDDAAAQINTATTPGARTSTGVPYTDSEGYFTKEGFNSLLKFALENGISRSDFIKNYSGYIGEGDPSNPYSNYGLTAAEKKAFIGY